MDVIVLKLYRSSNMLLFALSTTHTDLPRRHQINPWLYGTQRRSCLTNIITVWSGSTQNGCITPLENTIMSRCSLLEDEGIRLEEMLRVSRLDYRHIYKENVQHTLLRVHMSTVRQIMIHNFKIMRH